MKSTVRGRARGPKRGRAGSDQRRAKTDEWSDTEDRSSTSGPYLAEDLPPTMGAIGNRTAIGNAEELETAVDRLLRLIGENPDREGLMKTPERVARSLAYLTRGYDQDPYEVLGDAVFTENYEEMVLVRDIDVFSLCEHHLLPFFGRCHVAYIPSRKIAGLSKIARLVDIYARRLQVQERMTREIGRCIEKVLVPEGVGVVIEANHMCMMMRGVEKQNSIAVTSCMLGSFRRDPKVRMEFLDLIRTRRHS